MRHVGQFLLIISIFAGLKSFAQIKNVKIKQVESLIAQISEKKSFQEKREAAIEFSNQVAQQMIDVDPNKKSEMMHLIQLDTALAIADFKNLEKSDCSTRVGELQLSEKVDSLKSLSKETQAAIQIVEKICQK